MFTGFAFGSKGGTEGPEGTDGGILIKRGDLSRSTTQVYIEPLRDSSRGECYNAGQ